METPQDTLVPLREVVGLLMVQCGDVSETFYVSAGVESFESGIVEFEALIGFVCFLHRLFPYLTRDWILIG